MTVRTGRITLDFEWDDESESHPSEWNWKDLIGTARADVVLDVEHEEPIVIVCEHNEGWIGHTVFDVDPSGVHFITVDFDLIDNDPGYLGSWLGDLRTHYEALPEGHAARRLLNEIAARALGDLGSLALTSSWPRSTT